MTFDITEIILGVITILGGILTGFVIPLIKSKLNEKQYELFSTVVDTFVYAAEQLYQGEGQGDNRLTYVMARLKAKGYDVDDVSVRAAVEAKVLALHMSLGKNN